MSWAFFRREWGAVTFVLTVLVGMIVVPVALYLAGVGPGPATVVTPNTASTARESTARVATPANTPSPSASPSK
ncbi:MAG TPA: hypothetical protein VFL29_07900 [Candidatus Dormibacteraeota bacterium]|nr:hypothetical protein [Candidatus Dormibacteraeota bacterium]